MRCFILSDNLKIFFVTVIHVCNCFYIQLCFIGFAFFAGATQVIQKVGGSQVVALTNTAAGTRIIRQITPQIITGQAGATQIVVSGQSTPQIVVGGQSAAHVVVAGQQSTPIVVGGQQNIQQKQQHLQQQKQVLAQQQAQLQQIQAQVQQQQQLKIQALPGKKFKRDLKFT